MRRSSRSNGTLIFSASLLVLTACADDPAQRTLRPDTRPSFASAADASAFDFGTLGGADAQAISVNDVGDVVGIARDTSGFLRAFLWTPATGMRDLKIYPGPVHSFALDINSQGQVVGYVDSVNVARSFIRSANGVVTWLPTLGGTSTYAQGINENGDVVGSSETSSGFYHAFIWTATGGMRDLGNIGGPEACSFGNSAAYDVNDQRQVVGFACAESGERAFLWTEAGGMVDLGTLGGPFSSRAFDINNSGQVVGVAQSGVDGSNHAFLWTPGVGMRDLGTLGGIQSTARGINDLGEVVGDSYMTDNTIQRGFRWTEAGGMTELPGTSGSTSRGAYGINRSGQAVGWSVNSAGADRATGWGFSAPPPPPPVNHPPVANAGGPYAGVEGSPVAFSGSGTDPDGDQLTYTWWFGDGDSASTGAASHTYAQDSSYTAVLRVEDPSGASHAATAAVTVANVAPRVVIGPQPATIYSGDTLYLNASFSDPGLLDGPWSAEIDWTDGPPKALGIGNQSAPIGERHQYFRAGSYSVRVAITDKDGGVGADTVALTVERFPTVVDVVPGSSSNVISIKTGGKTLAVALLSTTTYDARLASPASTVITNGSGSGTRLRGTTVGRDYEHTDADGDGRVDLVLYYYKADMVASGDLTVGTTNLVLLANDTTGRETRGENAVTVKP
jgi:probable HAF family extracellular repeat protein